MAISVDFQAEFKQTITTLKRRRDITEAQFKTRALVIDDATRDKVLAELKKSVEALEAAHDLLFLR
jgi:hypothetical protein